MIAELSPRLYDVNGHKVFGPKRSQRRMGFRPTFPMARNFTQPLKHRCSSLEELRDFLCTCRPADVPVGRRRDYWQPPEEFEQTRTGDCVDFAIWTWRQMVEMGYRARFVGGSSGMYGEGHAWVTFEKDGGQFLLEPQRALLGLQMPRLSVVRYHPLMSVTWDGERIAYFEHEKRNLDPPLSKLPELVWEWLTFWIRYWARIIPKIFIALSRRILLGSK